jgi:flavin-dependent dehydrogenase
MAAQSRRCKAMREIAIVGGGPAGAICGERLAQAGFDVTVFDEHLAWEKPCGGGLTHKAIEKYPFLLDSPYPKKIVRTCELIASRGQRARLALDPPIVIYARTILNGLLLDRAMAAGCRLVRSHVTRVDTSCERVRLGVNGDEYAADFAVLAAGARNQLLPETTRLGPADLEQTVGYFVPAQEDTLKVKFLHQFEGYLWSFPRHDHLSVGICGKMSQNTTRQLKGHLDQFLRDEKIDASGGRFFSHVLPSPQADTLRQRRVVGRNWALVGDAAAWVDPLTGEGLYYALRSGDLLAQSLATQHPEEYPLRVRQEFSADLEFATRVARRFFRGRFLGGAVATRMIQFIQSSDTFRALICDLFSGAQDYRSLKGRLWAQLGTILTEIIASLLKPQTVATISEHTETPR